MVAIGQCNSSALDAIGRRQLLLPAVSWRKSEEVMT